jgi:predicted secreted Zn-dependent protease
MTDAEILDYLSEERAPILIAKHFGTTARAMAPRLNALIESGHIIRRVTSANSRYYSRTDKPYDPPQTETREERLARLGRYQVTKIEKNTSHTKGGLHGTRVNRITLAGMPV